jgi:hypothetical protein
VNEAPSRWFLGDFGGSQSRRYTGAVTTSVTVPDATIHGGKQKSFVTVGGKSANVLVSTS